LDALLPGKGSAWLIPSEIQEYMVVFIGIPFFKPFLNDSMSKIAMG